MRIFSQRQSKRLSEWHLNNIDSKKREMQVDSIRFLIASDAHLGHKEKVLNDSFEAFEEVLAHAKTQDVDFVLLGGDLFDQVNPSMDCFYRCLDILKSSVFGDTPPRICVTLNGDPLVGNLTNEQCQVSLPIFTIHGNHDYPVNDFGKISACDLLHISNQLIYFGKHLNLHQILVRPLLISKPHCSVKIALYGLGYIKDQLLTDMFEQRKVTFQLPIGNPQDYFKIFVIHQNRYKKNFRPGVPFTKSFDPRHIPEWIDLVIWGHEHEAIYKVEEESGRKIFQPGSTIPTAYIDTESIKKQCALVEVQPKQAFHIQPLLLEKAYRPMFIFSHSIQELKDKYGEEFDLQAFLDTAISQLLQQASKICNKKPVIRIKLEYCQPEEIARIKRLEIKYHNNVINRDKIIVFCKRKEEKASTVSDSELFKVIVDKKTTRGQPTFGNEIEEQIKRQADAQNIPFYSKELAKEAMGEMIRDETISNIDDIHKKRLGGYEKRQSKANDDRIQKMHLMRENEFKRAMLFQKEKQDLLINDIPPKHFSFSKQREEMQQAEKTAIDYNRYQGLIKAMEQQFSSQGAACSERQPQTAQMVEKQSTGPPSRQSILKREHDHDHSKHKSIDVERSDSEDCCKRAQNTPYDMQASTRNFKDAQRRLDETSKQKYKKPPAQKKLDLQNLLGKRSQKEAEESRSRPIKKGEGGNNSKNVRFSDDFV